jgi:anti-sigma-K factor RskA
MPAGPTYTPIASTTVSTLATTLTLSSIPSGYTDLVVAFSTNTTGVQTYIYFNGDRGTNYSITGVANSSTAVNPQRASNATELWIGATHQGYDYINISIPSYSNTSINKTVVARTNTPTQVWASVGTWRSTSAINSITFLTGGVQTFPIGSVLTIYGIVAA